MSHTPGPWELWSEEGNTDSGAFLYSVCHTDAADRFHFCVCQCRGKTAQEAKDNARLIAAAPELLETLKRIDLACTYPENEFMRTMRDVARAAIAKAEGK